MSIEIISWPAIATSLPTLLLPRSMMRKIAVLLVCLGLIQCGFGQSPGAARVKPDLVLISTQDPTVFHVELHNPGTKDLVLNLGMTLANGARQYVNEIHYTLSTPDGKTLHLEPMEPAIIAGRVDPLILPLPAGSTFSALVDLEKYFAPKEKVWKLKLSSGRYSLQAEYTGRGVSQSEANLDVKGIALMPFWNGTVSSPPLVFTVPSGENKHSH